MSLLRCFTIIGDSNVRRNLQSPSNTSGRPTMSEAQFIPGGGRLSVLSASLSAVRPESDACVVACISNLLTGSIASASLSTRVDPVISAFRDKVVSLARSRPALQVFVSPPMFRTVPVWYRDGLSEIMIRFANSFRDIDNRPTNLWLLASFSRPTLEADGVHLTPYSGIEYILHLFKAPEDLMATATTEVEQRVDVLTEAQRGLEDRVMVLEKDHAQLRHDTELQQAISAELFDYEANIKNEVFFMVQGLPRLPKLDQKEWQVQAVAAVNKVITAMGFDYTVKYVQNSTGRGAEARTLYKARASSAEASRAIRDKFASYFVGGQDSRPDSLSSVSIRNCVTPGTLARVAILQLLGKRYRDSNPGARSQVIAFESRPLLKLTPPPSSSDKRVLSFNFIEAITKLPTSFTKEEIEGLIKRISPSLHGSLRPLFVVINDDMLKHRSIRKRSAPASAPGAASTSPAPATSGSESEFRTPEGVANGRKRRAGAAGPSAKR